MSRPRRFDWLFRPNLADEDLPLSAEARFAEALSELPPVERSALALSEIGGLDTEEIASRMGTEPAVVRKLLDRARASVQTNLAGAGRRGVSALLPLQSWWQSGASAPAVRTAGAVAAAVVGTGVAIGGASAEAPLPPLTAPDTPAAHAIESSPPGRPLLARAAASTAAASPIRAHRRESVTVPQPRSRARVRVVPTRRGPLVERGSAPGRARADEARDPVTRRPVVPAAAPARPQRPRPQPVETVARTVPQVPAPAPVPVPVPVPAPAPPAELPALPRVEPPPLPVVPPPVVPGPPALP